MIVDPDNIGLDTLFVQLCAILPVYNGDTNFHTWDILLTC